jgi:hypothetical protein
MALSITTEEATEIKSNSMKFNANVDGLGEHELALCYFNYGHKSDLSDAQKSTGCALVDQPGHIEFLQDFIDDNQDYYYEANVQNYEATASQDLHLQDMRSFNLLTDKFADSAIAEFIVNNKYSLTKLLSEQSLITSYFNSGNLRKMWTGDIYAVYSNGSICVRAGRVDYIDRSVITLINNIDLTDYNYINIDWENNGDDGYRNVSQLLINGAVKREKHYIFSRTTEKIDISKINGFSEISLRAYDTDSRYKTDSDIRLYGIWLEK